MSDLDGLRFPIGRFTPSASSLPGIRAAHTNTLRLLPERIRAAVSGLSDSQLDTPYREDGWTVRQVVHHLADSHTEAYGRFKLAVTEEWPLIKPTDENAWAVLAVSRNFPLEGSLALLDAVQSNWVILLESMSEDDFRRGYEHSVRGRISLTHALAMYDWHSRHHTAHIVGLRTRLGW